MHEQSPTHDLITSLHRLRARSRLMLIVQRASVLVASVLGALLLGSLVDYAVRLPGIIRFVLLLGGVGGIGWFAVRYLWPAVRFAPSLVQLALRLESVLPSLEGRLASSVDFVLSGAQHDLVQRCITETQRRVRGVSFAAMLRRARVYQGLGAMGGMLAVCLVLALVTPVFVQTGLSRMLRPFGEAQWPARTSVRSLMTQVAGEALIFPQGRALPLRAEVTKGPDDQRVRARYRLLVDDDAGPWQVVVLTQQAGGVQERLIDAEADAVEVRFLTEDSFTSMQQVKLVVPPSVREAQLSVAPPAYAQERMASQTMALGNGGDERLAPRQSVLAGSQARLTVSFNKALPVPADPDGAWIAQTFDFNLDGATDIPAFTARDDGMQWTLAWAHTTSQTLRLNLVDSYGLENPEPIVFRIDATADLPPTVSMTQPASDESVLATAVVDLEADARDDVALAAVALEARVLAKDERIESASGEAVIEREPDWRDQQEVASAAVTQATHLPLETLNVAPGDVVVLHAVATDIFALDDTIHAPVFSSPRRLRIVTEIELGETFRRQLGTVRQNAIRIDAMQDDLREEIETRGLTPGADRQQGQIIRRLAEQKEAIEQLQGQIERNNLDDQALRSLLQQSESLLEAAGREAQDAADALEEAEAQRQAAEDAASNEDAPDTEAITRAQAEVQEELAALIELLDRDEDTWVITRQLNDITARQQALRDRTSELSPHTVGRDRDELTAAEREAIDRIAQEQSELAGQLDELLDELDRRADAMQAIDEQAAENLRDAAEQAREQEAPRTMEDAAAQAQENQLQRAAAAQQRALDALQQMQQTMQQQQKLRIEKLARALADLSASIKQLIEVQEREMAALRNAMDDPSGRDAAMIRLEQNTRALAGDTRLIDATTVQIARLLERAADAQAAAIGALRQRPADAPGALDAESRSLNLLVDARNAADELKQQVEEDIVRQQRQELVKAYRALAEQQAVLRRDTQPLVEQLPLNRRGLVEARRLSARQESIGIELQELEHNSAAVVEAQSFALVHDMIERWSRDTADALRGGDISIDEPDRQLLIADSLVRLADAMEDEAPDQPDFAEPEGDQEGNSGQGASGGPPPLVPPIKELKLIRGLQEQVLNRTRGVDERPDLDAASKQSRLGEIGMLQREILRLGEAVAAQMLQQQPAAPDAPEGAPDEPDRHQAPGLSTRKGAAS
jgi:hypothetical protein